MNTHEDDALTERRLARLTALLDADLSDDIAAQRSAARMRPVILAAAHRARHTTRRTHLLRAAAIVILLGGVIAVPPARAWIVDQVRELAGLLGVSLPATAPPAVTPDPTSEPAAAGAPTDADVRYSFDIRSPVLVVRMSAADGTLILRRGVGTDANTNAAEALRATAEAVNAPGTRFLVLPDGIAITSADATAAARFIISVPAHVREARITMRDGSVRILALDTTEWTVEIR